MPPKAPKPEGKLDLTEEDRKALLEEAIQKQEKLAESGLQIAKMFIEKGQILVVRRRLNEIVTEFSESAAAVEAKVLLKRF
jgi:outer membrane protein assembly factor BamD (BamD/ComL family)